MSNQYAKQRTIKDIENNDERIQVTGYIKEKSNNESIILDDKTGIIKVKITEIEEFTYDVNDLINVIGDLELQTDGEKILIAQFIQDMNKLNFEYYQKLYDLKKEL